MVELISMKMFDSGSVLTYTMSSLCKGRSKGKGMKTKESDQLPVEAPGEQPDLLHLPGLHAILELLGEVEEVASQRICANHKAKSDSESSRKSVVPI